MMILLQQPSNRLIDNYISQFNNDERYFIADRAIINLFKAFPANNKLEDILLKISVINDLYSTNIFSTFNLAKHIKRLNIDKDLNNGSPQLVHKIATGHEIRISHSNKEINFYSFATKYCNWHNRKDYAIYDSFVDKLLWAYKNSDGFDTFKRADLKDFNKFKLIIEKFISFYKLTSHNLKEIDKFLWIYGKEKFPNKNYSS
jgi:hypothetical protein